MSTTTQDNPNINRRLKYRCISTPKPIVDEMELRRRLTTWMHWRRYGLKGRTLTKRSKLEKKQALQLAVRFGIDMGGLK